MLLTRLVESVASQSDGDAPSEPWDLGGIRDLIGDFLRARLHSLEQRGGDFRKARPILESLSRSTGQKLSLTVGEIATECGSRPSPSGRCSRPCRPRA